MVKLIFLVALVANIALFGFIKGVWGPKASETHEPARLTAQIDPEKMHIIVTESAEDKAVASEQPPATQDNSTDTASSEENAGKETPVAENTVATQVPSTAQTLSQTPDNTQPMPSDPVKDNVPASAISNTVSPEQAAKTETPPQEAAKPAASAEPVKEAAPVPAVPKKEPEKTAVTVAPVTLREQVPMCMEAGYFAAVDARKFQAQVVKLSVPMKEVRRSVEEVVSYMVRIPSSNGQVGANRRAAELQQNDIHDFYIVPGTYTNESLRWSVSLGVFKTENAAKAYLNSVVDKGIKPIVITPRKATSSKIAFQFRNMSTAQQNQIKKVLSRFSGQDLHTCS